MRQKQRYRKVNVRIWNDAKFLSLSDDAKLLFLFLLTHPHMTGLGAMRHSLSGLAAELGWAFERVSQGFDQLFRKGLVEFDSRVCFIWLPRFLRYNPPENPNVVKGWESVLDLLPECELKVQMAQQVKGFVKGLPKSFRTLSEGFGEPFRKQEQEQEQEQEYKDTSVSSSCCAPLAAETATTSETATATPKRTCKYDPEDLEVAEYFVDRIREHVLPDLKKPNLDRWANEIRLMRERDGREANQIRAVINWAVKDDFWASNCLSPRKLRQHFDRLRAKMAGENRNSPGRAERDMGELFANRNAHQHD